MEWFFIAVVVAAAALSVYVAIKIEKALRDGR